MTDVAKMFNKYNFTEEEVLRFHEELVAHGIGLLYSKPKGVFRLKTLEEMFLCTCCAILTLSLSSVCFSQTFSAWRVGANNEKQDKDDFLITQDSAYLYRRNHEFLDLKNSAERLTLFDSKQYLSSAVTLNSQIVATDEQNVYLSEIYPEVTQEFRDTLYANDNKDVLNKIVEDYWSEFLFHTSTYEILRLQDIITGQIIYKCGYVIENTDMIYNFETNALEAYPNAIITKDANMNNIMKMSEATREDIILSFKNYLDDTIILDRTN